MDNSGMDEKLLGQLKARLDETFTWPCIYIFKFIVPQGETEAVVKLFKGHPTSERLSKNGNYVSVTAELEMPSSEEVIAIYREAAKIKGIIAL